MFQFPLIELEESSESHKIFHSDLSPFFKDLILNTSKHYTHILTHQKIEADFNVFHCKIDNSIQIPTNYIKINLKELKNYPIPKLIENFLSKSERKFFTI
jgi:adenine-specific DNA glycosylase